MKTITIDQLIACIEQATKTKQIKVPSEDYYARPGEAETQMLWYISPQALCEALHALNEEDE